MTERLYYNDSFLYEFDARITSVSQREGRTALVLDRTAFYPTSGGQTFDVGCLVVDGEKVRVEEVVEDETGSIFHYIAPNAKVPLEGSRAQGVVDSARRRDHIQQHSGQHVLSAAFVRMFNMQTVSFHMGDESCTIDVDAKALSSEQLRAVEAEANRVAMEDLPVAIKSATVENARAMGVRKIPDRVEGELRLIDMSGYDLNACGGTHVRSTGQIGAILVRKYEKVKLGFRVEFVCGNRAVATARKDFETLTEAAALYDTHIWQVPELIRKALNQGKAAAKEHKRLLEELADFMADRLLSEAVYLPLSSASENSELKDNFKLVAKVFDDREITFVKLLAQKITASGRAVALLGSSVEQAGLVFAQSTGLRYDMGALMKEAMGTLGGRGGGNRDMAQGGAANTEHLSVAVEAAARKVCGSE